MAIFRTKRIKDMYYTDSHEWIQIEGEIGVVGISTYAQQELGEIVYVQLPTVGVEVSAGDEIAILESTKAAADIYSPVSGRILEVNTVLQRDITALNTDPEKSGYLFKIELSKPEELQQLLSAQDYQDMTSAS